MKKENAISDEISIVGGWMGWDLVDGVRVGRGTEHLTVLTMKLKIMKILSLVNAARLMKILKTSETTYKNSKKKNKQDLLMTRHKNREDKSIVGEINLTVTVENNLWK